MNRRLRRVGVTSKSLFYAIVIHVIAGVLLVLNINWPSQVVSSPRSETAPVQANVVSESEIQEQMEAIKQKEEAEKQERLEAQKELEELLKKQEEEKQELAELKQRQEEEKKKAEELAGKKEQERQRLAKLKQKEEEQRQQAEAEAARAEAERQRKEAERKRKAAEERRKKELAKERERQLQEQLERERIQRRVNSALAQYIPIIKQKVSRNWNRPASVRTNIEAHVNVRLSQAGEVISARIVKSSGNPVFDRSVENAVLKASPLPIPQERGVNEQFRNLKLKFRPEEMIS